MKGANHREPCEEYFQPAVQPKVLGSRAKWLCLGSFVEEREMLPGDRESRESHGDPQILDLSDRVGGGGDYHSGRD